MAAHLEEFGVPAGVSIVEVYNGGSRGAEDQIAQAMAEAQNYRGIGGSDAHIVSHIGRCATKFELAIHSEQDLVNALKAGQFEAIKIKQEAS
jgi:histidinol phosphatase-like PHP family hydrolase